MAVGYCLESSSGVTVEGLRCVRVGVRLTVMNNVTLEFRSNADDAHTSLIDPVSVSAEGDRRVAYYLETPVNMDGVTVKRNPRLFTIVLEGDGAVAWYRLHGLPVSAHQAALDANPEVKAQVEAGVEPVKSAARRPRKKNVKSPKP